MLSFFHHVISNFSNLLGTEPFFKASWAVVVICIIAAFSSARHRKKFSLVAITIAASLLFINPDFTLTWLMALFLLSCFVLLLLSRSNLNEYIKALGVVATSAAAMAAAISISQSLALEHAAPIFVFA